MQEVWKDIIGYEGFYKVSNLGNILNVKRGKLLQQCVRRSGYKQVTLCKLSNLGRTQKVYKVHRLVAQAFIPNSNNYPAINHKDENKMNNCVENLEWCTHKYNINYGTRNSRVSESLKGHEMFIDAKLLSTYSHTPEVELKRKATKMRHKNVNR